MHCKAVFFQSITENAMVQKLVPRTCTCKQAVFFIYFFSFQPNFRYARFHEGNTYTQKYSVHVAGFEEADGRGKVSNFRWIKNVCKKYSAA